MGYDTGFYCHTDYSSCCKQMAMYTGEISVRNEPRFRRFEGGYILMIEIEKPKIETIEISDDAKYGKFIVEPLERGYGTTLGNSLRRILLSSLPGAAVTCYSN